MMLLKTEQGFPVGTLCFVDTKMRQTLSQEQTNKLEELAKLTMRLLQLKANHNEIDHTAMLPTETVAINQLSELINER